MAHYRLLDRLPSAIVTVDGSEKKIYEGNTIYLNKGDNFQFRFFNPLQEKIGVEIIFNGQKKNEGYLVLNPGQDISLDRFLDDKRKMSFDTYYINADNPSAVEAAALNGIVDINFYKEKFNYDVYFSRGLNGPAGPTGPTGSDGFSGSGGLGHFTNISSQTTNSNSRIYGSSKGMTSGTYTADSFQKDYWFPSREGEVNLDFDENGNLTETGRIEKGETSNQNLNLVDVEFENIPFHSIHYQLKPQSTRGYVTATEIRNYCPSCGYRIRKQSWKYCPKCGEKLM